VLKAQRGRLSAQARNLVAAAGRAVTSVSVGLVPVLLSGSLPALASAGLVEKGRVSPARTRSWMVGKVEGYADYKKHGKESQNNSQHPILHLRYTRPAAVLSEDSHRNVESFFDALCLNYTLAADCVSERLRRGSSANLCC
jgi:hypothetical protein